MKISDRDRQIIVLEAKDYTDIDLFIAEWATSSIFPDDADWKDIVLYLKYCYRLAHITVKEIRSHEGLSQEAFAARHFLSKRSVENWEGGQRECMDALRIALALGSGAVTLSEGSI